jgi:drug/metabolite transporter (DMT)-like permease
MTDLAIQFRGELAALSAALLWAIASCFYAGFGKQLSPMVLNLLKSGIAIALTLLTLALMGNLSPDMPASAVGLLCLSGVIGIGLGDTAFFESLNCLGTRRALLLEVLAPPLTALLALLFLQETLSLTNWIGILLTVGGVIWVVVERTPAVDQRNLRSRRGMVFGFLAALGQAIGAVLSRSALADTTVEPLWSALTRLSAGVGILLLWRLIQRQPWQDFAPVRSRQFLLGLIVTSFASTFLAIWLQQTALKYTAAGIAQSLTATSPLFIIPISLALRERVSIRAIFGVVIALLGIWILLR